MRHVIVGTAGHIDHGKTALVKALTGVDTDRLEEEKRRGISIDLGFAHLDLTPNLRLGFVDVPGHERFVKNMLAGASGVDLVLLVVAADESIMPQTREHFCGCRRLWTRAGVSAVTKADMVEETLTELVRIEVEEFVKGSFLEGAPIVPVSAKTGVGLDGLRVTLKLAAEKAVQKDASRYPRLPIDRAFSMRGFGCVVTGTLVAGSVSIEDQLELYPVEKRVRVRGLEVHNSHVERATAGERTAANLSGIDASEIRRGMTLGPPGILRATRQVDCAFDLLPGAHPLKHRAPVHLHAGTAEIEAQVRLLTSLEPLKPGSRGLVRFLLREPILMLPGDRFIVRSFSPVVTIGGGVVLDIAAPRRMRRAGLAERLARLEKATSAERISTLIAESGSGMAMAELIARTGLLESEIRTSTGAGAWFVDPAWAKEKTEKIRRILADFHRKNPLSPGVQKEELRSRELPGAPASLLNDLIAASRDLAAEGEVVRLATHRLSFKQDEEQALEKLEAQFRDAGLAVPATSEALAKSGVEAPRARSLLEILLKRRSLIRVGSDLVYHASALESLRRTLAPRKGTRFSVAEFKDWTGVSRKYAIPLLEFLDRERVTRRDGDSRIVR